MANAISKRAGAEETAKKFIKTLWKFDRGLFENLFRLAPYLTALAGVPWWMVIAGAFGMYRLGISAMDFGRLLDESLGTGPGQSFDLNNIASKVPAAVQELEQNASPKAANQAYTLTKEANLISALMRSGNLAFWVGKGLAKMVSKLVMLFGLASADELIREFARGEGHAGLLSKITDEEPSSDTEQDKPIEQQSPQKQDSKMTLLDELERKYKGV